MNIVILGAAGHVGSHVSKALKGERLTLVVHGADQVSRVRGTFPGAAVIPLEVNVVKGSMESQLFINPKEEKIDAVIYCVGHCPPGGFQAATSVSLSNFPWFELEREVRMHILGPHRAFSDLLYVLRPGGCFIFMSSAITRFLDMPREDRPALQAYHHICVIAAEDALIEGMRMDPVVAERNIKIHKIKPPAISDSPFHKGGPDLLVSVSTVQVVEMIVSCLNLNSHQDKTWGPR